MLQTVLFYQVHNFPTVLKRFEKYQKGFFVDQAVCKLHLLHVRLLIF